jgi:hypothetical protein
MQVCNYRCSSAFATVQPELNLVVVIFDRCLAENEIYWHMLTKTLALQRDIRHNRHRFH